MYLLGPTPVKAARGVKHRSVANMQQRRQIVTLMMMNAQGPWSVPPV